jgi:death-on-curing protein
VNQVGYLTLDDGVRLVRLLRIGPIRDNGLLDSVLLRPQSSAFGHDAYRTLDLKAVALPHSLTNNHALVDGNRRLAWVATVVFPDLNDARLELPDDKAFDLVWGIAGTDIGLQAIDRRLKVQGTV